MKVKELLKLERDCTMKDETEQSKQELKLIHEEIAVVISKNIRKEMESKLECLVKSKSPQNDVFKIRKGFKKNVSIDFPLKDKYGSIRVTREGIDQVIDSHFCKVFEQNIIPFGWEVYWQYIDKIYEQLSEDASNDVKEGPTFDEINEIIDS